MNKRAKETDYIECCFLSKSEMSILEMAAR